MSLIETERAKYQKVYQFPGYGAVGHGLKIAGYLTDRAPTRGVLGDFGCGRGGSLPPYLAAGFTIQPIDHVDVLAPVMGVHPQVRPVVVANLWADLLPTVDYGLCTDVMEHIPETHVPDTIANIARAVRHGCLWTVCHVPDVWGKRIGESLHMTVRDAGWWEGEFRKHWRLLEILKTSKGSSIYWTSH